MLRPDPYVPFLQFLRRSFPVSGAGALFGTFFGTTTSSDCPFAYMAGFRFALPGPDWQWALSVAHGLSRFPCMELPA